MYGTFYDDAEFENSALRDVKVVCRGADNIVPANSVSEEVGVRVACIVKSAARDPDKLLPVLMEDSLVAKKKIRSATAVKVHENVVSDAEAARVRVNTAMANQSWSRREAVLDMLPNKIQTLFATNRNFVIEHRFTLGMMGRNSRRGSRLHALATKGHRGVHRRAARRKALLFEFGVSKRFCS